MEFSFRKYYVFLAPFVCFKMNVLFFFFFAAISGDSIVAFTQSTYRNEEQPGCNWKLLYCESQAKEEFHCGLIAYFTMDTFVLRVINEQRLSVPRSYWSCMTSVLPLIPLLLRTAEKKSTGIILHMLLFTAFRLMWRWTVKCKVRHRSCWIMTQFDTFPNQLTQIATCCE